MDGGSKTPRGGGSRGVGTSRGAVQKPTKVFDESFNTIEAVRQTLGYVDKTLFIKEFLADETRAAILITAPPRFGKTTNMDMLKQFLLGNRQPFISEDHECKLYVQDKEWFDANCKRRPVIHADLKPLRSITRYAGFLQKFRNVLRRSFREHDYLLGRGPNGEDVWSSTKLIEERFPVDNFMKYFDQNQSKKLNESEIKMGLNILSEILEIHYGEKVYILIDEYDAPIIEGINNDEMFDGEMDWMFDLLRPAMRETLKGNKHLKRALLNACVFLEGGDISRDAHGVIHPCEFLNENGGFTQFYGFTSEDVDMLLMKPEFEELMKEKREKIASWYGGYKTARGDVYNAWSILNMLRHELEQKKAMGPETRKRKQSSSCKTYWIDAGYGKNLTALFAKMELREYIERLVNNEEVEIETMVPLSIKYVLTLKDTLEFREPIYDGTVFLLLRFLADMGYFNKKEIDWKNSILSVPNLEIKTELIRHCYNAEFWQDEYLLDRNRIVEYQEALNNLVTNATEANFSQLASSVTKLFSGPTKPLENENTLNNILFTLAYTYPSQNFDIRTKVHVEQEGAKVRRDILLTHDGTGIILELKFNPEEKESALAQIFDDWYDKIFETTEHKKITKKVYVGLSFYDKKGDEKTVVMYTIGSRNIEEANTVEASAEQD